MAAHEFARRLLNDPASVSRQLSKQLEAGITVDDLLALIDDYEDILRSAGYHTFARYFDRERERLRGRGSEAAGA